MKKTIQIPPQDRTSQERSGPSLLAHIMRLDNLKFNNIVKECCRGI